MASSRFSAAKTNVASKAVSSLVQRKSTDRPTRSELSHSVSNPSSYCYTRETIRSTEKIQPVLSLSKLSRKPSFDSLCPIFLLKTVSLHDPSKILHVLIILLHRSNNALFGRSLMLEESFIQGTVGNYDPIANAHIRFVYFCVKKNFNDDLSKRRRRSRKISFCMPTSNRKGEERERDRNTRNERL